MSCQTNKKTANTSAFIKDFNIPESFDRWSYTSATTKTTLTPTQNSISSQNNINVLIKGDLTVNGTIFNPSDSSIKENVEDINAETGDPVDVLEKVMQLCPKKYNLKYNKNKKTHYGFIAQDVEEIFPELVEHSTMNNKQIKALNYIEMIPLLLVKIQDLQRQIDELKLNNK